MNEIRKVSASAGAEWLLGGFGLLRKAPVGLVSLGVIYGAISLLAGMSIHLGMTAFLVVQLALVLAGPLLLGGFIYAARSVDRGGHAVPGDLLQGTQNGRLLRLWTMLLPQLVAVVICIVLLVVLVGIDELKAMVQIMEKLQTQATPDPELIKQMPLGSLMLWLLLAFAVGIIASFFTFVAVPEVMFTDSNAFSAMGRSFRACLRNILAMIVFLVLMLIAMMAIYVAVLIVGALVGLIAGPMAMQVVMQLLIMAIFMPVITGAMYFAWKQMLGDEEVGAVVAPVAGGIEA